MWKTVAPALLAGLLLAGCGTGTDAAVPMMEPGVVDGGAAGVSVEASKPMVPDRAVITTAHMAVRVEAVGDAVQAVQTLVATHDGVIDYQDFSNSVDGAYATITARVPSDRLETLIDEVSALGDVQNVSRQASDVTQQTVDLDARISALQASLDRLRALLEQTTNVADLVAVETEMSTRQAELDSLRAQRTYLANQVQMSTLTISLQPIVAGVTDSPGFVDGVRNGWNALVTLAGALVTAVGFLLPFALIAVVLLVVVWLLVRAWRRPRG